MNVSPAFSTHPRRAQHALALLVAVVVLFVGNVAFAAPAPMCDEHAQSIAAPFPIFPSANGEARSGRPCDGKPSYELGRAPGPERDHPQRAADTFDRAPPGAEFRLPRDRGRALPRTFESAPAIGDGFTGDVFRPPRSV